MSVRGCGLPAVNAEVSKPVKTKEPSAFRGPETLQNAAIVHAEAPVVLAAIPAERVGNGVSLIEFAARVGSLRPLNELKLMPGRPKSNGLVDTPSMPASPATSVMFE